MHFEMGTLYRVRVGLLFEVERGGTTTSLGSDVSPPTRLPLSPPVIVQFVPLIRGVLRP
jgi:hypothetical protein